MCKSQPTDEKPSLIGAWSGHVTIKNFGGSNHITGTAEPKVVKFCRRVGYINSSNRMIYHSQNGHGYGHVTFLNFAVCRDAAWVPQRQLSYLFFHILCLQINLI